MDLGERGPRFTNWSDPPYDDSTTPPQGNNKVMPVDPPPAPWAGSGQGPHAPPGFTEPYGTVASFSVTQTWFFTMPF